MTGTIRAKGTTPEVPTEPEPPFTAEEAAGYLASRGHAADAQAVLDEARTTPGRFAWTADRCTYAGLRPDGATFVAGLGFPGQYPHQPQQEAEAG
jgi:hypothetical protein